VSCSWARHFTLTTPLSTQVYKWVPANLMLGVTLRWTSIPSKGGVAIFLVASCYRNRDKLQPDGPLRLVCRLYLCLIGNRTLCRPTLSEQIRLLLHRHPILLITHMMTDRIGLHSVLLPSLMITLLSSLCGTKSV